MNNQAQEKELRSDILSFLDDVETAIIKSQYDLARKDIQEYREYILESTKIEANDGNQNSF